MDRSGFIEHRGKKIYRIDFSGLLPDELDPIIEKARADIQSQPRKSLFTMTKVDGARFNNAVISALKDFAKGNEPFVERAAIVGLGGLQKFVLDTVSRFSRRNFIVCGDEEEAKERLVDGS